jgi:hypothetical protein
MDTKQREICVKLFKWNVDKPMLPKMKVYIKYNEYEKEYERYKKAKNDYLLTLNTEFEKYPLVRYQMYETASKMMEQQVDEVSKISYKLAVQEINPKLSKIIKRMHATFQSMVCSQEQVLDSLYLHSAIGNALLDIKNEDLIPLCNYIHSASLYASDILDTTFKELIDILDDVKSKNKVYMKELVDKFSSNIEKYESLSAGLGLEGKVCLVGLDNNGYAYIKEEPFDMSFVEKDISRIWSLL